MYSPEPKRKWSRVPRQTPPKIVPSYIGREGLVGNWLFYNGAGTKLYDYSGRGNHGAISGPTWVDGPFGWALDFERANGEYVEVPDDPSLDLTDAITILAWVNADEFVDYESIVSKTPSTHYRMWIEAGPELRGEIGDTAGNRVGPVAGMSLSTDKWEQIGFTYEVTDPASDLTLYWNGSPKATAAGTTNDIATSNEPLWIGSSADRAYLNAQLAWLLIYDRKLSGSEVERFFEETRVLFGV